MPWGFQLWSPFWRGLGVTGISGHALGVPAVASAHARFVRGLDFRPRTGCSGRGFRHGAACAWPGFQATHWGFQPWPPPGIFCAWPRSQTTHSGYGMCT